MLKKIFFGLCSAAIVGLILFYEYLMLDVEKHSRGMSVSGVASRIENIGNAIQEMDAFTQHAERTFETTTSAVTTSIGEEPVADKGHSGNIFVSVRDDNNITTKLASSTETASTATKDIIRYDQKHILSQDIRRKMANRYLFPIVTKNGGPNFQYRQFVYSIYMALNTYRTIVLTDFNHHLRNLKLIYGIAFNETFDIDIFGEFIPAISIEEFREKCGSSVKNVLALPTFKHKPLSYVLSVFDLEREWLHSRTGITIPDSRSIPRTNAGIQNMFKKLEDEMCVVMISPESFRDTVHPPNEDITQSLFAHLIRTPFLRKTVSELMPQLCNGGPVLTFHWRNKTGELCLHEKMVCHDNYFEHQERMLELLSKDIKDIQRKRKINCVFAAYSPEESKHFLNIFKSYIPNVITMDDVINLHNPGIESYNGDDYFLSLIEQEICARSDVFIGNGKSNWSIFVLRERKVFDRGPTYDIIEDFPTISDIVLECYK